MRTALVVLVVLAAGCGQTEARREAEEQRDKERLSELRSKAVGLKLELRGMQIDLGGDRDHREHFRFAKDENYKKLLDELTAVVFEGNRILDRHPTWNTPRLNDDVTDTNL